VNTETVQLFCALLTVLAAFGVLALIVLRVVAGAGSAVAARTGRAVTDAGPWLAFLIAAVATLGSLYFSERVGFVPCRLCWYQRIAMYPLTVILLVGAIRKDPAVRWYAGPLAGIGALIAGYHTLIEWRPQLDTGACELTGPSCTYVWFREFGFLSLATMALVGFLTILSLLFVRFSATMTGDSGPSSPQETRQGDIVEMEHS
jgi:disulfide bond formation protein DsbB